MFFRLAPKGKVEKTRLALFGTTFVKPPLALSGSAQTKWWHETDLVGNVPNSVLSFGPDGESRKNAVVTVWEEFRKTAFCRYLEVPTQNVFFLAKTGSFISQNTGQIYGTLITI